MVCFQNLWSAAQIAESIHGFVQHFLTDDPALPTTKITQIKGHEGGLFMCLDSRLLVILISAIMSYDFQIMIL